MALTQIYVDPSIAADSGAGTIGDPYGDLEYAIEQTTFDTTNGTQVNIKSGATETLAAAINAAMADTSVSVAWVPSLAAPLVFRGYTSAANDGGKFTISGGGSVSVFSNTAQSYVHFVDGRCTNTGANNILAVDNNCAFVNLEVDTSTGIGIDCDVGCVISRCYVHDCSGTYAIGASGGGNQVSNNVVITDGATYGIGLGSASTADKNIVITNNIGDYGIRTAGTGVSIVGNSIYSSVANTAGGIYIVVGSPSAIIANNLIEGFSGTGGEGIRVDELLSVYGGNAFYNCTANTSGSDAIAVSLGDNETLTASPFTDAANNDFSPVDTGNVKEGSLPQSFNASYP